MKEFIVYRHIFPNGKVYIGITCQEPKKRWRYGCGYRHNQYITNAIRKYGWDNIKHEILFEGLTKEEAEQKEIELIKLYKSNQKEYGYNIENGGNHNGKHSEETKKKISKSNIGKKMPPMSEATKKRLSEKLKNRKISEDTKAKLREALKGNKNSLGIKLSEEQKQHLREINLGKKLSEETKQKISSSKKGQKPTNPFKKGNIPWNKGKTGIYSAQTKEKMKLSHSGERNPWYGKTLSKETRNKISEKKKGIRVGNSILMMKKIIQLDLDGNLIKIFECLKDAERELKIPYQNISMCCRGKIHKTHGYKFKYYEDEQTK